MQNNRDSTRSIDLVALFVTGLFAGAVLGAVTNTITGAISPLYFVNILGWQNVNDVLRASIAQGVFEGLFCGAILSLIFTTVVGVVTNASCPYSVSVRHLFRILGATLACWVLGGLFAMALSALSPEFYRNAFIGVPRDTGEMLLYAWVGGSIQGIEIGGLLSVIIASVLFRAKWRRQVSESE